MICPILTWKTSSNVIATVDPSGKVTGISPGDAKITAISGSITSNVSTISVTVTGKKFSVNNIKSGNTTKNIGVLVILDNAGTFTSDQACIEVCNRLGQKD